MPATPARIDLISNPYRSEVRTDAGIISRYGPAARDTKEDPAVSYVAQLNSLITLLFQRFTLLSTPKRRVNAVMPTIVSFTGAMAYNVTMPTVRVVDTEKVLDQDMLVVGFNCDDETEKTTLMCWG